MAFRRYCSGLLVGLLLAVGCQASPSQTGNGIPATPTVFIMRTSIAIIATPPTATPIQTPTVLPTDPFAIGAADTPPTLAAPPGTFNPKAILQSGTIANVRDSEIVFVAHITPQIAQIASASLTYTFDGSKKSGTKNVTLPPQTIGQALDLQTSLLMDDFAQTESALSYTWRYTDANGNTAASTVGHFKLTEATHADQRDDLPVLSATNQFASAFPDHARFTVTVKPPRPIIDARFYITQNHGILVNDYDAPIKSLNAGQPLTVTFNWNAAMSLQIPWQAFETWWVFTDELGHNYRTAHTVNDYTDNLGQKWTRTPTRYAVLYTYNQSASNVATLAAATDHSIEALQADFGYKLLYVPHIVLYNSNADFGEWAPPSIEDQFIGMASGRWGGAVIGVYRSIHFTGYSIIKHELTHVFQYQATEKEQAQWFIEGSARYMEEEPIEDYEAVTRKLCKAYGPPTLQLAVPARSPDGRVNAWPYYVGMTVIKYLRATYGKDAFAKTYLALAHGVDLTTAIQTVTGKPYADFDKDWQTWITH